MSRVNPFLTLRLGQFLIYVVCKMSGTPKSDNENVKLLLTVQLWTMDCIWYIWYIVYTYLGLCSGTWLIGGLSGVWHHQTTCRII